MPQDHPTPPPPPPVGTHLPNPAYGQPQRARRSALFWVAIIGGCFGALILVLLILAAIGLPQLLKIKKTANQVSAIETIRSIGMAEMTYNTSLPVQWLRLLSCQPRGRLQIRSPWRASSPVD